MYNTHDWHVYNVDEYPGIHYAYMFLNTAINTQILYAYRVFYSTVLNTVFLIITRVVNFFFLLETPKYIIPLTYKKKFGFLSQLFGTPSINFDIIVRSGCNFELIGFIGTKLMVHIIEFKSPIDCLK